jgi:Enoyl-(Acyl carrier protein) reductase
MKVSTSIAMTAAVVDGVAERGGSLEISDCFLSGPSQRARRKARYHSGVARTYMFTLAELDNVIPLVRAIVPPTPKAVRWGKRGARINTISPGIIMTPLAKDELTGPRGEGYRRMIALSPAGRAGTPDEVAAVAALLMGPDGGFITGSDFLMDGGVTAAYWDGDLAPQ